MNLSPTPEADVERPERRPRYGLSVVRDIVIAPNAAFDKIALSHEWLPTYGAIVVASGLVTLLSAPALLHVAAVTPPPPGETVPTTAAGIDSAKRSLIAAVAIAQIVMPFAVMLLTASALTTVARLKGLVAPYVLFLSLAANCAIPSVIGSLLSAVVLRAHDPASFHDLRALIVASPTSLAVFAAPGNDRELAFLSHFDIFDAWGYVLLAFGFARLVSVSFTTALVVAFGLYFLFAIIFP